MTADLYWVECGDILDEYDNSEMTQDNRDFKQEFTRDLSLWHQRFMVGIPVDILQGW